MEEKEAEFNPRKNIININKVSPEENCYQILGVESNATLGAIKKAYYSKQRENIAGFGCEPSEEQKKKAQLVNAAYEILSDPEQKALYDEYLADPAAFDAKTAKEEAASVHSEEDLEAGGGRATTFWDQFGKLYPATTASLDLLLTKLNALEEKGFNWRNYWEENPYYVNRTFLGQSVKGGKIMETLSASGFVFYQLRSLFLQKLWNIILLLCGSGTTCLIPEFVFMFLSCCVYLIVYQAFAKDDFSNPPVGWLKNIRMVLYLFEAIFLIITLAVATENGVPGGIGFIIGLPNFWVCLVLFLSNKKKGYSGMSIDDAFESAQARALIKKGFPDYIFLLDATLNGILSRGGVSLSSIPALIWVIWGLLIDLRPLCENEETRRNRPDRDVCYSWLHLCEVTNATTRKITNCSHDKMFSSFNQAIDENFDVYTFKSYYAVRILLFQLKNLAWIGEWKLYREEMWARTQQRYEGCFSCCPAFPVVSLSSLPTFRFPSLPRFTTLPRDEPAEDAKGSTKSGEVSVDEIDIETGQEQEQVQPEPVEENPEYTPCSSEEPEVNTGKEEIKEGEENANEIKNDKESAPEKIEKTEIAEVKDDTEAKIELEKDEGGIEKKPVNRREMEEIDL